MKNIVVSTDISNKALLAILISVVVVIFLLPYGAKLVLWFLSSNKFKKLKSEQKKMILHNICIAIDQLIVKKIGAIVTIERKIPVKNFVNAGEEINAEINSSLIHAIFQNKSPLHDGAIVISGDKITLAGTYYRVSTKKIDSKYGTRHRASLGISEQTDAVTIVVSEERGKISITRNGSIKAINSTDLYTFLEYIFV